MPGGKNPPIAVIKSWPKPNYINPETRGPEVRIGSIILGIATLLVVCARLWARFVVVRRPGLDDYLIIVSAV